MRSSVMCHRERCTAPGANRLPRLAGNVAAEVAFATARVRLQALFRAVMQEEAAKIVRAELHADPALLARMEHALRSAKGVA